jgi:threonine/homoserine/homoserine lactone efflux protein
MLFLLAFALGFVGYLPPGNINLTVVQMSVGERKRHWQLFILFAALMEFIYCFGCLWSLQILLKQTQLITLLGWSAVVIFLLLGIFSFLPSPKTDTGSALSSGVKRGVLIAIFNPLQVPFWLVWGVYVMQDSWLKKDPFSIAIFSFACSVGTIAVLYMYAEAGKKLVERLKVNKAVLDRFIGSLLIFLAVYQCVKLLSHG